ncbi:translation initiation factor IF-3 [Paenibacillus athensensis]|uniref:Translation initiation factor IF-3 n=1 Tax=Paenibacillus athensensis TaxID=1967502 RepID=A0A4Y8PSC6_9BACL|nr:translation initiation factor IF-3 [Paenibacillus athensensis]MCD1260567.1 translation initiation factor IF-3 [Paenibacillus athensensis]
MILNEKIKASAVELTGVDGEDLGVVPTAEALSLAKKLKVDLVCLSLMSSPPPCRLMPRGTARQEADAIKQQARKREQSPKVKEIRLTPQIEDHDYETKRNQAQRCLQAGDAVLLVVKTHGSKEAPQAKALLERLCGELKPYGAKLTGIQSSGKGAQVQLQPLQP